MEIRKKTFEKLDLLAKSRGISYYRLGKELNISSVVFTDWKNGKSMPKADKLIKIAEYFGVKLEYFYE